jgi:hypothetical protein
MTDLGPDGEIFDDGNIYVPFPPDPEIDLFDPLDG